MLVAILSFTAMAIAGRAIQVEMNTFELMLYRSSIGWIIVTLIISCGASGLREIRTAHPGLHIKRNLIHFSGQNLWFYAIAVIPLGQMVALEFTNPIWVALLAPFMLGETLTRVRVIAALIGFCGVLVVAQPGAEPLEIGHAAALLAALFFAANTIFTKQIMRYDSVLCVLFWMTLSQTAMSLVLSLPGGIPWPSADVLPWIGVVGLTGLSAHFALTSALSHAPAAVVAPMEFLRLPFFTLVGVWLYGEPLRIAVLAGAALIIGGNLLNLHGERNRRVT